MSLTAPAADSYLELIRRARREDLGAGDVTSEAAIPADRHGVGTLVFREPGVLCGMPVVEQVLSEYDRELTLSDAFPDGSDVSVGRAVGSISGPLRSLLSAERVVLNFLQRLSGIATVTGRYVEAVAQTSVRIYDTRKTTPGWRELEKYAVRCGGGLNHRHGLFDAVLIKDNHLAALGKSDLAEALTNLVQKVMQRPEAMGFIEVEVDSLEQLPSVLGVEGVDMVLLDNMTPQQLSAAVEARNAAYADKRVLLEASGNITLDNVRQVAQAGVDRISIGALTHSAKSLDIGFDLNPERTSTR